MRKIRKLLTVFAAFFLVLGLTINVQANNGVNENNGEITVTNPIEGKNYSLYQLLELESYNTANGAYAYKVTNVWKAFFDQPAISGTNGYVSIDKQGYVTWNKDKLTADSIAEFAKTALAYAKVKENKIDPVDTKTATKANLTDGKLVFSELNLGYYLLDSSVGALCSLQTTAPEVDITEKNTVPTVTKKVEENSNGEWGNKNDANTGDTVNYQTTINIGEGAQDYVLHDKMSNGLTFKKIISVELQNSNGALKNQLVEGAHWNLHTPAEDGDTFDIEFTEAAHALFEATNKIVVSYSAILNENAVIAGEGNSNTTNLTYGDSTDTTNKTPDSETKTYTWPFGVYKKGLNDANHSVALQGATFKLTTAPTDKMLPIRFVEVQNTEIPTYRVATVKEINDGSITKIESITTDENGKFILKGLDAGTYYLTETKAPDGYNKLADPIEVIINSLPTEDEKNLGYNITAAGKPTTNEIMDDTQGIAVEVENKKGTLLPSTGGMGTTLLYTIGAGLIVISGILLITKKRMSHE